MRVDRHYRRVAATTESARNRVSVPLTSAVDSSTATRLLGDIPQKQFPPDFLVRFSTRKVTRKLVSCNFGYRARKLYKNISMLFLFPVKDGKLSTGVNATFDASCYG